MLECASEDKRFSMSTLPGALVSSSDNLILIDLLLDAVFQLITLCPPGELPHEALGRSIQGSLPRILNPPQPDKGRGDWIG